MKIIPVFLPYAGCQSRCIYCNQNIATGVKSIPDPQKLQQKIKDIINKMDNGFYVGFYGGSFLALDYKKITEYLNGIPQSPLFKGIRLSTTFKSVNDKKLHDLKIKYNITDIEFGLESTDKKVLENCGRINDLDNAEYAVNVCKKNGIRVHLHLMYGLPFDTKEKYIKTCKYAAALSPDGIRIHPAIVLKNTGLEKMYKAGKYTPPELYDSANTIAGSLDIFLKKGIKITRLGLFPDVSLQKKGNVIAGPFHPSYGSIVNSFYYRRIIEKKKLAPGEYEISVNPKYASYIAGHKKMNIEYFEKKSVKIKIIQEKNSKYLTILKKNVKIFN